VSRQAQAGRHTAKAAGRIGGGRKPEDDPEGRPEGRAEAKGASPEWKSDLKGTGRTGSQEPVRNGRPGDWFQAQAGRQRKGTPRQGQRAGLTEAGGASRTWKRTSRRADSKAQAGGIESPRVQAGGSWPLREAQAARQVQRVAEQASGPMPRGWIEGESRRDDPKGWAETSDTGRKVRARSQRFQLDGIARGSAQNSGREAKAGHLREQTRGLAGRRQETKARAARFELESSAGRKAAGGLGGGEGRKPGAETQPEGEAGGRAARQP